MKTITIKGVTFGEGRPKICVPIVGRTKEEIYEAAREIEKHPVDLVEWRADWYEGVKDPRKVCGLLEGLGELLTNYPLLVTFRTKQEGGEKELRFEEYRDFILQVTETKRADLVDVELSKGEKLVLEILREVHERGVYVVLSSHDFEKTPKKEEMIRKMRLMQNLGGDMAKLAVMPNSRRDVLTLMDATLEMEEKWAKGPIITMSMAGTGTISRLTGEFFGSALTFGTVGKASAPGQIPAKELKAVLDTLHHSFRQEQKKGSLFLIGFMGSGKSAVASVLEKKYHFSRVEMDREIEVQQGMKISEIFEKFGEEYFRKVESCFVEELGTQKELVVSCGGGVVLNPKNVENMKKGGTVVLLRASAETILERVRYDEKRPLLKGKKNVKAIRELMEIRRECYEAAADIIIDTDKKSLESIASEILTAIG